jgi:hypothetical protein
MTRARLHAAVFAALMTAAVGCGAQLSMSSVPEVPRSHDPYVEALVQRAHALDVAHSVQWLRLGHYRQGLLGPGFLGGGYTSQADGEGLFLSPHGKVDPQAELDATLRAFFAPVPTRPSTPKETPNDAHALCRFPARFLYLQGALGLDASRMPVQSCPAFEHFYADLQPQSVTLIFSSYYLNSPASAFGHTFLRINKANTLAIGKKKELLDYGIDFSANVDSNNAVLYAIKGLAGLFPGTFKQIPYYYKVRQYNDTESRDLWEYELALTPSQLATLIAHLWELGHTYFDYYYLGENCSYHILGLIEVATPDLDLTSRVSSPVLPTDTVKVLTAAPGLVRDVHYRPSLRTQFRARVADMSGDEQALVEDLVHDPDAPLPASVDPRSRIRVLDAAADLIDVHYGEALVMKTNSEAAKRKQRVLERRAAIQLPSETLDIRPPWDKAPEAGHDSHRVGLGAAGAYGMVAPTLDLRVCLHDLADPSNGYPELNAIEFMHARVQLWPDGKLQVDDLAAFRVTSLTAQNTFDRKLSWKFDVGGLTLDDRTCRRCFATHIGGGAGMAFAPFGERFMLFITTDAAAFYAPALHGIGGSPTRLGVGPAAGLRLRFLPNLVSLWTAQYLWLPWQAPYAVYRADAILRWEYVRNVAISLEARAMPSAYQGQLLSFVYF